MNVNRALGQAYVSMMLMILLLIVIINTTYILPYLVVLFVAFLLLSAARFCLSGMVLVVASARILCVAGAAILLMGFANFYFFVPRPLSEPQNVAMFVVGFIVCVLLVGYCFPPQQKPSAAE